MKEKHIWEEVNKNLSSENVRKDKCYNEIKNKYFSKDKKKTRLWQWFMMPLASLVVVVLGILIYFVAIENKPPLEYAEDNKIIVESTIEEINSSSEYFYFNFDVVDKPKIKKFYDSVSGDTLMYSVECVYAESDVILFFASNERYNYQYDVTLLDKNANVGKLQLRYSRQYEDYLLTIKSFSEKQGQKITITYRELSEDGSESNFWNFIEVFIAIK